MTKRLIAFVFVFAAFLAALPSPAHSQGVAGAEAAQGGDCVACWAAALPAGYGPLRLGMSVEDAESALVSDPAFGYRGERDVSMLPDQERTLIETDTRTTAPSSFLEQCFLRFHEGRLYIITLNLRASKIDYHSVFTALTEKYGEPLSLSPQKSEWRDDSVIMSLERPLTLKYTGRAVYDAIENASSAAETTEEADSLFPGRALAPRTP